MPPDFFLLPLLMLLLLQVVLTDQQHILPLLKHNVARNFLPDTMSHSNNSSSSQFGWGSGSPPFPTQLGLSTAATGAVAGAGLAAGEESWQRGNGMDACVSPDSHQEQQQGQQLLERWGVPCVREYTWGAPMEPLLHSLSSTALQHPSASGGAGEGHLQQQQQGQAQQQAAGVCFDVIVGADLLYAPQAHSALLASLAALAAPHTQVGGG